VTTNENIRSQAESAALKALKKAKLPSELASNIAKIVTEVSSGRLDQNFIEALVTTAGDAKELLERLKTSSNTCIEKQNELIGQHHENLASYKKSERKLADKLNAKLIEEGQKATAAKQAGSSAPAA
jgi:hypothetical protein